MIHLVSADQLLKKADTLSVVCGIEEGPSSSVPSFSGLVTKATAFICFPAEMGYATTCYEKELALTHRVGVFRVLGFYRRTRNVFR